MRLQRRDTGLGVDGQTLVVRVPGIRCRGGGELVLKLSAEGDRVERGGLTLLTQADLDQVGAQLFLHDLPVQTLQSLTDFGGHGRGLLGCLLGGAVGVDVLEHGAVVPDRGLNDLPLGEPDLLQRFLGLLDLRGDALGEHRRQVVTDPHPRLVRQARDQRDLLDGCVVPQLRGIGRVGLPGEVGDLPRCHPFPPHRCVAEFVHPLAALGQVLEG
ncbi:hypothetical protein [Streptomyces sp. NPDC007100]|uniref:hypothetical protein n=1 Tax=Streptomyces sp. NPDC007100 TaxID=3155602 RepID=UPI00340119ED